MITDYKVNITPPREQVPSLGESSAAAARSQEMYLRTANIGREIGDDMNKQQLAFNADARADRQQSIDQQRIEKQQALEDRRVKMEEALNPERIREIQTHISAMGLQNQLAQSEIDSKKSMALGQMFITQHFINNPGATELPPIPKQYKDDPWFTRGVATGYAQGQALVSDSDAALNKVASRKALNDRLIWAHQQGLSWTEDDAKSPKGFQTYQQQAVVAPVVSKLQDEFNVPRPRIDSILNDPANMIDAGKDDDGNPVKVLSTAAISKLNSLAESAKAEREQNYKLSQLKQQGENQLAVKQAQSVTREYTVRVEAAANKFRAKIGAIGKDVTAAPVKKEAAYAAAEEEYQAELKAAKEGVQTALAAPAPTAAPGAVTLTGKDGKPVVVPDLGL